jgi:hypothetical protein
MEAFGFINRLLESDAFSTKVMSEILQDKPLKTLNNLMSFSDKFLPYSIPSEGGGNAQLVMKSSGGLMAAYNGGDVVTGTLHGYDLIRYGRELSFAEQFLFTKKDLERLADMRAPLQDKSYADWIAASIQQGKQDLEFRRADIVRQLINNNSLSIDSNGTYISESGIWGSATDSRYYLSLESGASGTFTDASTLTGDFAFDVDASDYYWDEANAKIVSNLRSLVFYIKNRLHRNITAIYVPELVLKALAGDAEIKAIFNQHGYRTITKENIMEGIPGIDIPILPARTHYYLTAETTSSITLGSSGTFDVNDASSFAVGDYFTVENPTTREEYDGQITNVSSNTITADINGSGTVNKGARVVTSKPLIDYDKVVVELSDKYTQWLATRNVWAGSEEAPGYGYYAFTDKNPDRRRPEVYTMVGYEGILSTYKPNHVTLKVLS